MLQHLGLIHPLPRFIRYGGLMTAASVARWPSLLCGGFNAATAGVLALGVTRLVRLDAGDHLDRGGRIANWLAAGGSGDPVENAHCCRGLPPARCCTVCMRQPPARSFRHWSLLLAIPDADPSCCWER